MTANGRTNSGDVNPADAGESESGEIEDRGAQSPSGVFRTRDDERRRDAGWTVAEQYEHEGFSYRLLRRPIELEEGPPRLTKREEHAVILACEGHTNKSIAQVMEVSPSTVGVLLFRAANKLKAKSRSELLSNYEQFKVALQMDGTVADEDDEGADP
jgi:DNA-binding CsgD family transcriptional regulator